MLTVAQQRLIDLFRTPGMNSVKAARELKVSPQAVCEMIDRLERHGHVLRARRYKRRLLVLGTEPHTRQAQATPRSCVDELGVVDWVAAWRRLDGEDQLQVGCAAIELLARTALPDHPAARVINDIVRIATPELWKDEHA